MAGKNVTARQKTQVKHNAPQLQRAAREEGGWD
jgi:hypothetical protein